ncbi:MAG: elongation factor G [Candidatus Latescibacteria bacterium]|nr:elongation factor G [Candidatus Latescibacterota bacterium]
MRDYNQANLRNICLAGHGGSGKTSLAEALLYTTGQISRLGTIETGNTTSDYRQEEIDHKISMGVTPLYCEWDQCTINILDTPGFTDFTGDVKCAMRVADGVIVMLRALEGIEVETDRAWKYADEYGLPRMIVINLLDKEHTDFFDTLSRVQQRYGTQAVPITLPIGENESFSGVIDLINMKALNYQVEGDGKPTLGDIPENQIDIAMEYREKLMEIVAESNDELLEQYFEAGELTQAQLLDALRKGICTGSIYPTLCTSASHNIGTSAVLNAITTLMPSPTDRPTFRALQDGTDEELLLEADSSGPLSALIFKTVSEQHIGELSYFRVYSGAIRHGDDVYNTSKDTTERFGQMYITLGRERTEMGTVRAGEIAAVVKLKDTHTGDTICSRANKITLPRITFSDPVAEVAVSPKSKEDEEKISMGLSRLHEEDPSFINRYDPELKQMILAGAGEMHLEMVVERLERRFGVSVDMVKPRLPYRETIRGTSEKQGRFKRQSGGRGQFGDAWIKIEPSLRGHGYEFVDEIVGGAVPHRFIPAVDKGIQEAMDEGVVAGYPVVDIKATLYDGSFHSVDSSEMAFKIAASLGFKSAVKDARPVLLEPVYEVEVLVPEDYMGDVMGDLSARRGRILGMDQKGGLQLVRAEVPLAELYRYSTALRSMTHGRGSHSRRFLRYDDMPQDVQKKTIEESEESKEQA